jgi:Protein of unknown function (DUF1353)
MLPAKRPFPVCPMLRIPPFVLMSLLTLPLAACVTSQSDLATQKIAVSEECLVGKCRFNNAPLKLDPEKIRLKGRSYEFQRVAERLDFIDASGWNWLAPEKSLTDGASIPEIFVPLVGFPNEPRFVNAAALHDAYCGIGNEEGPVYHSKTWQEVHRLFYDALVASGTSDLKAKIMFAAVWLGGPRWYPKGAPDRKLDAVPDKAKQDAFVETKAFIQAENPDMPELIVFLEKETAKLLRKAPQPSDEGNDFKGKDRTNESTDPTQY